MQVILPGHRYHLDNFEDPSEGQVLQFIQKEGIPGQLGKTDMVTINDGTTNEEVLKVLIDRLLFLNEKFPCKENSCCITHLQEGLMWLEERTRNRIKRGVEGKNQK